MEYPIQQGQTTVPLVFLLISTTDHITGLTGASPAVTISKNGAAFAVPAGAVTEIGNGWYKVAPNATDAGTLGPLALHATAAGADPCDVDFLVVAYSPYTTSLGLSLAKGTNLTGLNDIAANAIVSGGAINTASGKVSEVALVDTLTTYTGNTPQTGDSFARLGANGAGLTSIPYTGPSAGAIQSGLATTSGLVTLSTQVGSPAQAGVAVTVGTNNDKTGYAISATGLNAIPGFNGWSLPQMLRALAALLVGKRTGVPAAGVAGTTTFVDPTGNVAYGTITTDASGDITADGLTPPA
jgi:hypothetical protein